MSYIERFADAYPEQLLAATLDEIRRRERQRVARELAARRRSARRAARRARLSRWWHR